jgi:hypothetical protein
VEFYTAAARQAAVTQTDVQSPNGMIKLHSDQIEACGSAQMGRITLTPFNFQQDHINKAIANCYGYKDKHNQVRTPWTVRKNFKHNKWPTSFTAIK